MADHSVAATLKSVRTHVLNELTAHNAIDLADRETDWQTTLDNLTAKFDDLSNSIITITRLAAAPALAPEPRTSTMRLEVPTLNATDPQGDWHSFKPQMLAIFAQNNIASRAGWSRTISSTGPGRSPPSRRPSSSAL